MSATLLWPSLSKPRSLQRLKSVQSSVAAPPSRIFSQQFRKKAKKSWMPKRISANVKPGRRIIYTTPDKNTCAECPCYPYEEPYILPKKLIEFQVTSRTLFELCCIVLEEAFEYPEIFKWNTKQVADWMAVVIGLPQYKNCILDNNIDGKRLLWLEDPSVCPRINIHDFKHIKLITAGVRKAYKVEAERFLRSIGLPQRKPPTYAVWFKSRTGPSWGVRQSWTIIDILQWMKIIAPFPEHLDHWDLVWHNEPEFPKTKLARVPDTFEREHIPRYEPPEEYCNEYTMSRKFRIQKNIPEDAQYIWMEHLPGSPSRKEPVVEKVKKRKKKRHYASKKVSPVPAKSGPKWLIGKGVDSRTEENA